MKEFIVAVDIAKKRDYFATMILKDVARIVAGNTTLNTADRIIHHYDIVYLYQRKGLRYEEMTDEVVRITQHSSIVLNHDLIVDGTGVGEAAVDLLRKEGLYPIPIVFTGGESYHEIYEDIGRVFQNAPGKLSASKTLKELRIPKQDLVTAGKVLMQQGRIHLAQGVDHREALEEQLMNFKGKVNEKTKKIKYGAEDDEVHDDFVV